MNTEILSNLIDKFSKMFFQIVWFAPLMVFSATYTNISVISWRSVLLLEETGEPGVKHRPVIRDKTL